MSETKKRKLHTPEYKAKVALEALRSSKTINQIGQEFDVHPVQVGLWKKAIQEHAKTLFEGKRGLALALVFSAAFTWVRQYMVVSSAKTVT